MFVNRDPIEEQGGVNLYGFCRNNSVNLWDYLGLDSDYARNGDLQIIDNRVFVAQVVGIDPATGSQITRWTPTGETASQMEDRLQFQYSAAVAANRNWAQANLVGGQDDWMAMADSLYQEQLRIQAYEAQNALNAMQDQLTALQNTQNTTTVVPAAPPPATPVQPTSSPPAAPPSVSVSSSGPEYTGPVGGVPAFGPMRVPAVPPSNTGLTTGEFLTAAWQGASSALTVKASAGWSFGPVGSQFGLSHNMADGWLGGSAAATASSSPRGFSLSGTGYVAVSGGWTSSKRPTEFTYAFGLGFPVYAQLDFGFGKEGFSGWRATIGPGGGFTAGFRNSVKTTTIIGADVSPDGTLRTHVMKPPLPPPWWPSYPYW